MLISLHVISQKAACSSALHRNTYRTDFSVCFSSFPLSNATVNYSPPDAYTLGQDHIWSNSELFCKDFLLPGELQNAFGWKGPLEFT